jgi:hypothetical protein
MVTAALGSDAQHKLRLPASRSCLRRPVHQVGSRPFQTDEPGAPVVGDTYATAYLIGCCGVSDAAARVIQIIDALPLHDVLPGTVAATCFIKAFTNLILNEQADAFCLLTAALGFDPGHIASRWLMAALNTDIPGRSEAGSDRFEALADDC